MEIFSKFDQNADFGINTTEVGLLRKMLNGRRIKDKCKIISQIFTKYGKVISVKVRQNYAKQTRFSTLHYHFIIYPCSI